jgi:hypothetical protein
VLRHSPIVLVVVGKNTKSCEVVVTGVKQVQVVPNLETAEKQICCVFVTPNFFFQILIWITGGKDLFAALKPKPTALFGVLISAFEVLKLVFDLFVNVFFPRDSQTVIE